MGIQNATEPITTTDFVRSIDTGLNSLSDMDYVELCSSTVFIIHPLQGSHLNRLPFLCFFFILYEDWNNSCFNVGLFARKTLYTKQMCRLYVHVHCALCLYTLYIFTYQRLTFKPAK